MSAHKIGCGGGNRTHGVRRTEAYETSDIATNRPRNRKLVANEGIEPSSPANQAGVFPLYESATENWWTMRESNPLFRIASATYSQPTHSPQENDW